MENNLNKQIQENEHIEQERTTGFYWVIRDNNDPKYEVAYWDIAFRWWCIIGFDETLDDTDFDLILEQPLHPPSDDSTITNAILTTIH